jgi:ligand-binding SRPBCC domain-containing protein
MAEPVSASIHIDAPPEAVWAMVTDLPRMSEWSPENTGGRWAGGTSSAKVGARFKGTNTNGPKSWKTATKVVACDAPTYFAFDTMVGPMSVARWSYRITPSADGHGCDVTEQWDDKRWGPLPVISNAYTGVKDRAGFTKTSIETTLANLKAAAEVHAG